MFARLLEAGDDHILKSIDFVVGNFVTTITNEKILSLKGIKK